MLYAADFRKQAREKLGEKWTGGKWATFALIALIYSAIIGVCGALTAIYVGEIVAFIIAGPLTAGLALIAMRVMRDNDIKIDMLFSGFKDMGRTFLLYFLNGFFTFLWSLLLIIPGIIMSFAYSMSYYILLDHPTMTANEARKKSIELMRGYKWRLFCLQFSFIGWQLLCVLTCGILEFWVMPYMQTAQAAFYEEIIRNAGYAPEAESPAASVNVTSGYGPRATTTSTVRIPCPKCGAMNNADAKFCSTCGGKIEVAVCHNCGATNPTDTQFCSKCGHKLADIKCSACGAINAEGTKFCTKCGTALDGAKCPYCGAINADGTKFCVKCGNKLESENVCSACGTQNVEGSVYCSACGKKLAREQAPAAQNDGAHAKASDADTTVCPECGEHNDSDTRFCINCGKKLK